MQNALKMNQNPIHLSDGGRFYPSTGSETLSGGGKKVINVGWDPIEGDWFNKIKVRDEEYYYICEKVLWKVIEEFSPEMCVIAAGFDALTGDPTTEGKVSLQKAYPYMARKLQELSKGNVILILEGGYEIKNVAESIWDVIEALDMRNKLHYKFDEPNFIGIQTVDRLQKELSPFWTILKK